VRIFERLNSKGFKGFFNTLSKGHLREAQRKPQNKLMFKYYFYTAQRKHKIKADAEP